MSLLEEQEKQEEQDEKKILRNIFYLGVQNKLLLKKLKKLLRLRGYGVDFLNMFVFETEQGFLFVREIENNKIRVQNTKNEHFYLTFGKNEAFSYIRFFFNGVCRYYEIKGEDKFELYEISIKSDFGEIFLYKDNYIISYNHELFPVDIILKKKVGTFILDEDIVTNMLKAKEIGDLDVKHQDEVVETLFQKLKLKNIEYDEIEILPHGI